MHNAIFLEYLIFHQELLKFSLVALTTSSAREVSDVSFRHKSR